MKYLFEDEFHRIFSHYPNADYKTHLTEEVRNFKTTLKKCCWTEDDVISIGIDFAYHYGLFNSLRGSRAGVMAYPDFMGIYLATYLCSECGYKGEFVQAGTMRAWIKKLAYQHFLYEIHLYDYKTREYSFDEIKSQFQDLAWKNRGITLSITAQLVIDDLENRGELW